MQRLRTRLPPVNALVAFEASARHESFTDAARELGVTREAVSRQIRILEVHVGVKLFIRQHRAIKLSAPGREFNTTVHRALEDIATATQSLDKTARSRKITVTATVAIASFWLTPRLPSFRRLHPNVEIRVIVSDTALDMDREGIDVGLRYGNGDWTGYESVHLFGCDSFPVCSRNYVASAPAIENEIDLVHHPLLNLDGPVHETEDWRWWLNRTGGKPIDMDTLDVVGFDNYANVMQATLEGQGIALGFSGIVDKLLASGELVQPVELVRSPGHAVYVVRTNAQPSSGVAAEFFEWVLAESSVTA